MSSTFSDQGHSESMELRNQLPVSHPLTASVHPPERITGPSQ